jgi:PBSX family phage portal protein
MAKEKIQKGRVFVETSKGIFPYAALKKAESKKGSSQQLSESTNKWMLQNDLVPPPYAPTSFWTLYESNPILFRCVNQLASDVAGIGWTFRLQEGKKDNQAELNRLKEFVKDKPDVEDSFRTVLKRLLIDWGALGYCGLEVARNNKQDVADVYHVPAHTLRVHKSKIKYCQVRNNKKVWFKKFGETKNISEKTGKNISGGKDKANELIFYKNYYPKSDYYGVPNCISAVGDITGLIGLRDYNLSFFENYGIPAALITLEGEWEDGSEGKIQNFLNKEIRGSSNAHRTLVAKLPEGGKLVYDKLSVDVKEASFRLYEQSRRENILIAYSMPPERVGVKVTGPLGGESTKETMEVYIQSVVEPLQLDFEEIINSKLLNSEIYRLKFNDIDLKNYDAMIDRMTKAVGVGLLTPNEARNELGRKPYIEGDKFYMPPNLVEAGEADAESKLSKEDERFIDELEAENEIY